MSRLAPNAAARTAVRRPAQQAARERQPRILRVAKDLGERIPASERARVPRDFSAQLDHYLYGTPKR